jgi:hypothetical protein
MEVCENLVREIDALLESVEIDDVSRYTIKLIVKKYYW